MTNEEQEIIQAGAILEREHKRLNEQFLRLLACLYPNQIGQHDVEYIINGKKEIKDNE